LTGLSSRVHLVDHLQYLAPRNPEDPPSRLPSPHTRLHTRQGTPSWTSSFRSLPGWVRRSHRALLWLRMPSIAPCTSSPHAPLPPCALHPFLASEHSTHFRVSSPPLPEGWGLTRALPGLRGPSRAREALIALSYTGRPPHHTFRILHCVAPQNAPRLSSAPCAQSIHSTSPLPFYALHTPLSTQRSNVRLLSLLS